MRCEKGKYKKKFFFNIYMMSELWCRRQTMRALLMKHVFMWNMRLEFLIKSEKGFKQKSLIFTFSIFSTLACCCSERGEKFIFRALIRLLGERAEKLFSKSKQKLIKYKVRICWKLESLEAFSRLKAQLLPLKVDSLLPAWWEKWVVDTKKLKFPAGNSSSF